MTRYYYGKTGKSISANEVTNNYLGKITFGLFQKVGFPSVISKNDCMIVARILRGQVDWCAKFGCQNGKLNDAFRGFDLSYLDADERKYFLKFATFLEESDGLINT